MSSALDLIKRNFGCSDGQLLVGGVPVSEIANNFGTPLFIYDQTILERNHERLRRTFPSEFSIHYSIKANPNPAIIKFFLARGCGLEVASGGELQQALAAGCSQERILFAGPGKTESEIEAALRDKVGELHAESLLEIRRIGCISRGLGLKARVSLRINPGEEAQGGAMRMGGKATPFGIDEEQLGVALDAARSEPAIDLCGVHLFSGTQILNHETLIRQYSKGFKIARQIAEELGRTLATIDFGGGLGIPYFSGEQNLDMDRLRDGIAGLMTDVGREASVSGTRLIIEPGRYLVGESGIYLTRINDIKTSRGKKFLILDGGMNHHLAASGNLGQTIKRNFPVAVVNRLDSDKTEIVDVVGPLCTPLDVLARSAELPKAEVGDLFAVFQSGAYGRTASPLGFLSHPHPAELMVNDRNIHLI